MKPAPAPWGYYADGNFVEVDRKIFAYAGYYPPFQIRGEAGVMHDVVELGAVEKVARPKRVPTGPTPTEVMQSIQEAVRWQCPHVTLHRNNVGTGWVGSVLRHSGGEMVLKFPRPLRAGLEKGSADLIGWTEVVVTEAMVGQRLAVFTSVEVKSGSGRLEPDQRDWRDKVTAAGGIARTLRSAGEVTREVFEP